MDALLEGAKAWQLADKRGCAAGESGVAIDIPPLARC